jgi:hypothetical protein
LQVQIERIACGSSLGEAASIACAKFTADTEWPLYSTRFGAVTDGSWPVADELGRTAAVDPFRTVVSDGYR